VNLGLADRVAFVTGGSRGVGWACAAALLHLTELVWHVDGNSVQTI